MSHVSGRYRKKQVPEGYKDIVVYDDFGHRVTNVRTLRSIMEGQRIIAEWEARMDRYERERLLGELREEEDIDRAEESN